jgi:outer membrane biogenesis lipoprotein LolB
MVKIILYIINHTNYNIMKKLQLILIAAAITILTACGGSTPNKDVHVHEDGCTHSQGSATNDDEPNQESFTVETDSTHSHDKDTCSAKKAKTHTHADGKVHTH